MRLHSVVDNMTNSSSTTYSWPINGAKEKIRAILQEILDLGGATKSVDDVFDIYEVVDPDWVSMLPEVQDWLKLTEEDIQEAKETGMCMALYDYGGDEIRHFQLKVVAKNNKDNDILKKITELFASDEVSFHTLLFTED